MLKMLKIAFLFLFNIIIFQSSPIVSLNESTYISTISQHPLVLVLFYSIYGQGYIDPETEINAMSIELDKIGKNLPIYKVDILQNSAIRSLYNFTSIPELKLIGNYNISYVIDSFKGGIKKVYIYDWVLKSMENYNIEVDMVAEVEEYIGKHEKVMMFIGDIGEEDIYKEYKRVSLEDDDYHDIYFIYSFSKDVIEKYRKNNENLIFFRQFDVEPARLYIENIENIYDFIDKYRFPLILSFNDKTKNKILGSQDPLLWLFLNNDDPEEDISIKSSFMEAVNYIKDICIDCLYVIYNDGYQDGLVSLYIRSLGVSEKSMPCMRYIKENENDGDPIVYFYEEANYEVESIIRFYKGIMEGRIKQKGVEKKEIIEEDVYEEKSHVKVILYIYT